MGCQQLRHRCLRYCKSTIFQANHNSTFLLLRLCVLFAILQKYDFSSKSQLKKTIPFDCVSCLRYCKSTIFQANHNYLHPRHSFQTVVCDTAKVRFFKQITTAPQTLKIMCCCLRYCKSTIFQANHNCKRTWYIDVYVVCDTAKVRFFKQITTRLITLIKTLLLFAILQKYDFSSKSQLCWFKPTRPHGCLRYCKSTIFQANHNPRNIILFAFWVVCDTAKVRFFKQITTHLLHRISHIGCLRYCKSTIFQANHNSIFVTRLSSPVVCDTAKVRFFKQITTNLADLTVLMGCLRYCKSTIFQANHNWSIHYWYDWLVVCDTAKVRFFKQITTPSRYNSTLTGCLRYCKSTIFQANHNFTKAFGEKPSVVCDTAKVRFFKQITTLLGIALFQ